MSAEHGGIRANSGTTDVRELRDELSRELAIYRRLDALADRSLSLLAGGGGSAGLIPILEEKRGLLAEARIIHAAGRAVREEVRRPGRPADGEMLAEVDQLTGDMEHLLRETMRKEEEVDLRLRGRGDPAVSVRFARGAWAARAFAAEPPPPAGRLVSVG